MREERFEALGRGGAIYFLESPDGSCVKIGYSANLPSRLNEIGSQMPGLRLLGWISGNMNDEKRFHARCRADRVRGEWYSKSPALREILDAARLKGLGEFPKKIRGVSSQQRLQKTAAASIHLGGLWSTLKEADALKAGSVADLIAFTVRFQTRVERERKRLDRDTRILVELRWLKSLAVRYSKGDRSANLTVALSRRGTLASSERREAARHATERRWRKP